MVRTDFAAGSFKSLAARSGRPCPRTPTLLGLLRSSVWVMPADVCCKTCASLLHGFENSVACQGSSLALDVGHGESWRCWRSVCHVLELRLARLGWHWPSSVGVCQVTCLFRAWGKSAALVGGRLLLEGGPQQRQPAPVCCWRTTTKAAPSAHTKQTPPLCVRCLLFASQGGGSVRQRLLRTQRLCCIARGQGCYWWRSSLKYHGVVARRLGA